MREVLKIIAKEFNANKVLWAIGGSLVLKEYSIVERANDIDILISLKDVDVVLEIMNNLGLDKTPPKKAEYGTDVIIPYSSLEEWYVAYSLMHGREVKAKLIEEYFAKNGAKHKDLIIRALQQKLPENVKGKLEKMIKE